MVESDLQDAWSITQRLARVVDSLLDRLEVMKEDVGEIGKTVAVLQADRQEIDPAVMAHRLTCLEATVAQVSAGHRLVRLAILAGGLAGILVSVGFYVLAWHWLFAT